MMPSSIDDGIVNRGWHHQIDDGIFYVSEQENISDHVL